MLRPHANLDPGPHNALGAVKFMFPNQYHVYLHDTPNQAGYDARLRAMSWGCVHVFEPLQLAEKLIAKPSQWNLAAIEMQVASKKSETIYLDDPVPILLLYWTVTVPKGGPVEFIPDIYGRDGAVLRALKKPTKVAMPPPSRSRPSLNCRMQFSARTPPSSS